MRLCFLAQCLLELQLITSTYTLAITGVHSGVNEATGQRPFRQEISLLQKSGPAFDLFILSLQQFQREDQSALLSYYQVAGIHGHPYREWDGVQGPYDAGYCTHVSVLFPSWHRPYMALFEQIIWSNAQTIAASYSTDQRSTYQSAATTLRVPYWDWSLNVTMPDIVNIPEIRINTPQGQMMLINPLYNYTFHPLPSAPDFPVEDFLSGFTSTVRSPDENGRSEPDQINQELQANFAFFHDSTYQLFTSQTNYTFFSNTGASPAGRGTLSYNSLENIHDAIHNTVGNGGHMSDIAFAAFDPIFWLHHINVDRLFAIWQAIYPSSYITPEVNVEGTYTIAPGSIDSIDSPLTPFHSDPESTLYSSVSARFTRDFGYAYPEVIDWNVTMDQLSSNVRAIVNKLYNPTGNISPTRGLLTRASNKTHFYPNSTSQRTSTEEWQYHINIRVQKSALSMPYFIHFFLSTPPSDPSTWPTAPNHIGTHSLLHFYDISPKSHTKYRNPRLRSVFYNSTIRTRYPNYTYGQIPVTQALVSNAASLEPNHVVPMLGEKLEWRIRCVNGVEVEANELKDLEIFVVGRKVQTGETGAKNEFPNYGKWEVFEDATRGKKGGVKVGEKIV